jgi:hypothetical protein
MSSSKDVAGRVITAVEEAGGVLLPAIRKLMQEAWDEGFKQGGPMHDEHYGEPDKHKINPYGATPDTPASHTSLT